MLAYHVCECTRSAPTQSPAMLTSTPRVCIAALPSASSVRSAYAVVPASSRGSPKQRTCTSMSPRERNARTSSAT